MKSRSKVCLLTLLFCLVGVALSAPVFAADKGDIAKRLELSRKMHEIRPVKDQVESAILKVAQLKPPAERLAFILALQENLDYEVLEKKSVDAMAEVYSLKELEAMVAYYGTPEAISAAKKYPKFAAKVQPEINKMLDQAIMRARVGKQPLK